MQIEYSSYPIRQINSSDHHGKKDVFHNIILVASDPFKGHLPLSVFEKTEYLAAEASRDSWQEFYITDPFSDNAIICSFGIIHKLGNHNNLNLLIGNVHTNPKYRKKGFITYLISETIQKYESVGQHQFSGDKSENKDADQFIKENIDTSKYTYYWTLYSGVSDFYKRFGFEAIGEMDWLTFDEQDTGSLSTIEEVKEYPGSEVILLGDEAKSTIGKYFEDPKYASYVNDTKNPLHRSTNFSVPMIGKFWIRDQVVCEYYDRRYSYVGLRILHHDIDKETFVIISGAAEYNGILVHKLFTNLSTSESETLHKDLEQILKFLKLAYSDYEMLKFDHIKSFKFMITTGDIHAKDAETKKTIVSILLGQNWILDTSNKSFLPMMKEFGQDGVRDGVKWINNGFWCFG
ncbi:unnamed protein product [Kuraishia capsulata CBS 1993]|uniref:Uncharacterized protein n=1 Tax=Kuraishia capsulata CBS 1993 TaxID=1382522 RepID=W6ML23_9ASCO|nr:uncharacterized protein KUCA_T00003136001 [Kuraishia capsulata CBS 1993]CDK27159.1 unnamed protein product [Kuraishia capsulata CBS 1993]